MKHVRLLTWSIVCLLLGHMSVSAASEPVRPNIILILADDIGFECFGCYGSEQYKTPHIDQMAKRGMRFSQCYAQPLCTPTRVKLMTGLSNARNYAAFSILPRDQQTIGQYFRANGYETAIAGKWQLFGAEHYGKRFRGQGTMPEDAGFQHACLWQVDKLGERFHGPLMYIDGENRQFDASHYGPAVATDYLIEFMRDHQDTPFFAYYPMILTHNPFVPTPNSNDRTGKNRQANFEDMVSYMDGLVGRLVSATEELGISDRTLILFTGDNGTNRSITSTLGNVEIKGGKGLTTDAGTRVPLVALWPGVIEPEAICDDLVDSSDFLPTVLEACQLETPPDLDGRSFFAQLTGKEGNPRQWLYCFYCPRPEKTKPIRFARDQRFKLYGDGRFYDVSGDPLEQQPLGEPPAGSPAEVAHRKLQQALAEMPSVGQKLWD